MRKGRLLTLPAAAWLAVFFLLPILFVFVLSFWERGTYGELIKSFTLQNFERVFDPLYGRVLWETLKIAILTTVLCLIIGYPFAYTVTMVSKRRQSLLLLLVTIPFWINFLVRSYAWIVILRSQGVVNTLLLELGLIHEPLQLLYNTPAVVLGMVYTLLPFMILPVYVSLEQFDKRRLEAAYDLGATPWKAFWSITLPLTIPGVAAGSIFVSISSIGMFVVSDMMGGSKVSLIGNVIQNQFLGARDWPFGAALSFMLMLFSVLFIYLYYKTVRRYSAAEGGREV